MYLKSLLCLFFLASLIAINYQSLVDPEDESDSLVTVQGWLSTGRTKRPTLLNDWHNLSQRHPILSQKKPSSKWLNQDEEAALADLAELNRLKLANSSINSLVPSIEGSIVHPTYDNKIVIVVKDYVLGTCTCSINGFNCNYAYQSQITNYDLPTTYYSNFWDCLATRTCATICSTVSVGCGVTCTTFTSLTASSRVTRQYYDINSYANGVYLGGNQIYTNAATITSSSSSIYNDANCISCTTTTVTSSTTFTSTVTSTTTSTSTTTVTSSTTLTSTSTTTLTTTETDTTTLISPTTIYQVSTCTSDMNSYCDVGAAAAVAAAAAVGMAVGIRFGVKDNKIAEIESEESNTGYIAPIMEYADGVAVPFNQLSIPVTGQDFFLDNLNEEAIYSQRSTSQGDHCDDGSIIFDDGICYPLLRQGPCPDRQQWLTVDPITLQGRCSLRLCGRGRVFVGRTGLCHDDDDRMECRGGRKLFYTAYGDPICECPPGQFPYPSPQNDCLALFTQGPCRDGLVMSFSSEGRFVCSLDGQQQQKSTRKQNVVINDYQLRLMPADNGLYYPLGSSGPCRPSFLFDYDVFQLKTTCTILSLLEEDEEDQFDETYNQLYPGNDFYRVSMVDGEEQWQLIQRNRFPFAYYKTPNELERYRVIDQPNGVSRVHDQLLIPCRPGKRNGNNFKCANSFLIPKKTRTRQKAVKSVFDCGSSGGTLQATGECSTESDASKSASCGPSYVYVATLGQCQQFFEV